MSTSKLRQNRFVCASAFWTRPRVNELLRSAREDEKLLSYTSETFLDDHNRYSCCFIPGAGRRHPHRRTSASARAGGAAKRRIERSSETGAGTCRDDDCYTAWAAHQFRQRRLRHRAK